MSRWKLGTAALALALLVGDLLAEAHGSGWHAWAGFDLVYGLVGCVLIVVLSKALGKAGLQRGEDFYGEDRP